LRATQHGRRKAACIEPGETDPSDTREFQEKVHWALYTRNRRAEKETRALIKSFHQFLYTANHNTQVCVEISSWEVRVQKYLKSTIYEYTSKSLVIVHKTSLGIIMQN
jgi:hypothetical protein